MPTAPYKFIRDDRNSKGLMSSNRASTDALQALHSWINGSSGRSFKEVIDEDELLLVDLTWNETDILVGKELENACGNVGIKYFPANATTPKGD